MASFDEEPPHFFDSFRGIKQNKVGGLWRRNVKPKFKLKSPAAASGGGIGRREEERRGEEWSGVGCYPEGSAVQPSHFSQRTMIERGGGGRACERARL